MQKLLNHYIAILAVIAHIGILFVPAVSAGKIINYGPIQGTIKTIPVVIYTPAPVVFTPKTIPFTYLPSKWSNTILPNPTSDNGRGFRGYHDSKSNYNPGYGYFVHLPKEEAIKNTLNSVSNISLTSDPSATLTAQRVTYDFRSYEYTKNIPVWIVTLSGVSTDPNAIGVRQWINRDTEEIIDVPIHANRWVTIDAITGKILLIESCW